MSEADPEDASAPPPAAAEPPPRSPLRSSRHSGRWVGVAGLVIILSIVLNTVLSRPTGASGIPPGTRLPPFAVPLAGDDLPGDADIATHANDGSAGRVAACRERGAMILNVCQLYEQGPVALALFIDAGSCERVLATMERLMGSFPEVHFAAVAIGGGRGRVRRLLRSYGLTFPVGIDEDGALAGLYKLGSCPQVSFVYRGGVVAQHALLSTPSEGALRARLAALLAASRARGDVP